MSRGRVLFVDDEKELRESAVEWLALSGFSVRSAASASEALGTLRTGGFDVLVTDIRMPGMDGMALLDAVQADAPDLAVVLLTGHGDVSLAVEAMRRGAHDFLEKPYDADHLVAVLDRAAGAGRMRREIARLRAAGAEGAGLERRLIGNAPSVVGLRSKVLQLADIDVDILILGETGTGKEVVARALHDFGKRAAAPFVAINCAAIPETVFESEIFGHERGAFTGAVGRRIGRIQHAEGGTVFLDEIESMPEPLQPKLLRVIQERLVEPVGSNRQVPVDVRFIAASKVALDHASRTAGFRPDLYFRLSTVTLELPPLSARRADIGLLFAHFVNEAAQRHGIPARPVGAALVARLANAKWEGNVRELRAAAERHVLGLAVRSGGEWSQAAGAERPASLPDSVAAFESAMIAEAMAEAGGSVRHAAERLGIPRRTLSEKIARYGLRSDEDTPDFAEDRQ